MVEVRHGDSYNNILSYIKLYYYSFCVAIIYLSIKYVS